MRPKLLSLLAISAIALAGCSAPAPAPSEPEKTPTKVTETTDPATGETIKLDANGYEIEPSEKTSPSTTSNSDEEFLDQVHQELERHAEYFATAVPKKMLTDEALLKQGRTLCKKIKNGTIDPNPVTDDAGLADLEMLVRTPAGQLSC